MKRALENENGDHPTLSRKKRKELKSPSALQPVKEFEYAMLDALLNKDLDKGNAAFDHFRKLGVLPSHNCYSHMVITTFNCKCIINFASLLTVTNALSCV